MRLTDGGLSKTRLGRVGEVMGGYVKRGEVPGVVALVARGAAYAELAERGTAPAP